MQLHNEKDLTKPAVLEVITPTQVRLTISEGRYHQVKRMFEDGIIIISGNKPPQKHKVKDGDMILIQKEELDKSVNRSLHDIG